NHDERLLSDTLSKFENLILDDKDNISFRYIESEVSDSQKVSFNKGQEYSKKRLHRSRISRSSRISNSSITKSSQHTNTQEPSNFVQYDHLFCEKEYFATF
ncbi:38819_t:CDS:1, partial [Gigaspora margarita]